MPFLSPTRTLSAVRDLCLYPTDLGCVLHRWHHELVVLYHWTTATALGSRPVDSRCEATVTQVVQCSHRLEKYVNIQGCLEKSLKIEFALKRILPFTGGYNSVFRDLNQYIMVVPLFGAAYAAPKKGTTILY